VKLAGREAETEVLARAFADARAGRSQTLGLLGVAGIG
jgi:predicted ATPase